MIQITRLPTMSSEVEAMTECKDCNCGNVSVAPNRNIEIRQAKRLALMTIVWNLFEGSAALILGSFCGSVALVGFGLDSTIETASASLVAWRFWSEERGGSKEKHDQLEQNTAKSIGILLLVLATYIAFDATRRLMGWGEQAKESWPGVLLTVAALVVMPLLARAKYNSAKALNSGAMKAEAFQSVACAWLAGTTLLGLVLNAWFHWSWADPAAALLFLPTIIREGLNALKGELCSDCQ